MDSTLLDLADKAIQYASIQGIQYCDVRAETETIKSLLIENGEIEHVRDISDKGIGIRILKDGAWGFYAITNPQTFEDVKEAINQTIKITNSLSQKKKQSHQIISCKYQKDKKRLFGFKKTTFRRFD